MVYKKHSWIQYGRQGEIVKIAITDSSGMKIDHFQCNNNKDYRKILKIIKDKYGFDFKPSIEKRKSQELEKEKNWLKDEEDMKW